LGATDTQDVIQIIGCAWINNLEGLKRRIVVGDHEIISNSYLLRVVVVYEFHRFELWKLGEVE